MSASGPPGDRGRGRGRARGRPSRVEALRRQAYRDAIGEDELAAPGRDPPHNDEELPQAHGQPVRDAPAVPVVPMRLIQNYREGLPALPTNPLGSYVVEYANAGERRLSELRQEPGLTFAEEFWSPAQNVWDSASLVAQAAARGMHPKQIRRSERRLAAAAELAEREMQHHAITQIAAAGEQAELLCFIEGARYDEATTVLTVGQPPSDLIMAAGATFDGISAALLEVLESDEPKEAVPAKVFQTESQWYALVAVPTGDPAQPKRLHAITSEAITSPQVMAQNTGQAVARALTASTTTRLQTVKDFRWKMRLVCSDRGPPNMAAERMIMQSRTGWHSLFFPCEVHMSTACQGKGLQLMDGAVTKYIRTALSLRLGGWMRLFRRCMLREVFLTLEVLEGVPSPEVQLYRRRAMCMFMRSRKEQRKHAAMLSCLPNGDWRLYDRMQVFVPPGKEWDKMSVSLLIAKALMTALAGSNFKVFNRKRWTDNDHAVNQLGLLESCHNLLSRTYRRWLKAVGYRGPLKHLLEDKPAPAPPVAVPAVAPMMLADGVAEPDDRGDVPPAIAEAEADVGGEAHEPLHAALDLQLAILPGGLPDTADFAKQNEQNRTIAADWILQGCPLRDLVLTRIVMEPAMVVLRRQLHLGSHRWDLDQEQKLLERPAAQRRDYRLLICARGSLTHCLLCTMAMCSIPRPCSMWGHLAVGTRSSLASHSEWRLGRVQNMSGSWHGGIADRHSSSS